MEGRSPHLGNLPGIDAVESELRDGDRATGRLDAEECLAVRSRVGEVRGDPRRIYHEAAQLPPIVRERAYNGSQLAGVRIKSAVGAVDRYVARNELGKVLEPVLVAARVVATIERREFLVGHAAKGCILPRPLRARSPGARLATTSPGVDWPEGPAARTLLVPGAATRERFETTRAIGEREGVL
jgi:hypothetical protein